MSKPKLTPWFPPEVKPVHVGEYNASISMDPGMRRWWDGQEWSLAYPASYSEKEKKIWRNTVARYSTSHKRIYWRGLKEKPKGKP